MFHHVNLYEVLFNSLDQFTNGLFLLRRQIFLTVFVVNGQKYDLSLYPHKIDKPE